MERFKDLEGYDIGDVLDIWTSSSNAVRKDSEMSSILYDAVDGSEPVDVLYRWIGNKGSGDPIYKAKGEVRYDLISTTTENYHEGLIPYDNEDGSMGFFYNNCKAVLEIRGAKGYRIPSGYSNGYGSQNEVITYGVFRVDGVRDDTAEWHDYNSNKDKWKPIKVYEISYINDDQIQEEYREELQKGKVSSEDPVSYLMEKGILERERDGYIVNFPSMKQVLKNVSTLEEYDSDVSTLFDNGRLIVPIKEWNGYMSFRYIRSWDNFPKIVNGDVFIVSDIGVEGCPITKCTGELSIR